MNIITSIKTTNLNYFRHYLRNLDCLYSQPYLIIVLGEIYGIPGAGADFINLLFLIKFYFKFILKTIYFFKAIKKFLI